MKLNIVIVTILMLTISGAKQWGPERENVEMMKRWKLIDYLDLEEKQGEQFFFKLKSFENELTKIDKERKSLHSTLKEMIDDGNTNGSKVGEISEKLINLEIARIELKKKHIHETGKILSPEQQVKYLLFERQFKHKLKEHLRRRKQQPFTPRRGPRY